MDDKVDLPSQKTNVRIGRGWAFVLALLFVGACAGVTAQRQRVPGTMQADAKPADATRAPVAVPPPFIAPPPLAAERWVMPDMGLKAPDFPYLPGESRSVSRSVGSVTHGWLVNARRIAQPDPFLQSLPIQYERGLNFTSDAMYELLASAARHVAQKYPGAVVHLGNFSAQGGGDIPYSFSHTSGRDGDVGFFLRGPDGQPVTPRGLVGLDANGRYKTSDPDGKEVVYSFDTARNWALVEGFIQADAANLQYIFVSNPLKSMLLAEARRQGAAREVIQKASVLLHQPGGALPHNDHFHLRIYCSEIDVRSGCQEVGRQVAGYQSHQGARQQVLAQARALLGAAPGSAAPASDDPAAQLNLEQAAELRVAAVRRLGLMQARSERRAILAALEDPDPRVRAAAARVTGELALDSAALAHRVSREDDPQVLLEVVSALGAIADEVALDALVSELGAPRPITLPDAPGGGPVDARIFVAQAIIFTESEKPVPALIAMLDAEHERVRESALGALRILTNHQLVAGGEAAATSTSDPSTMRAHEVLHSATQPSPAQVAALWRDWWAQHGGQKRDDWLVSGFRAAGYSVNKLNIKHVWDLCRAVADDDYLSYNAQRILMRLAKREPESLSWSKEDANFYWRRWFERRWRAFGAPPIPAELSTLK